MELQQIVERYAEAIEHVDEHTVAVSANARTGEVYQAGFKALDEAPAVDAIDDAWEVLYPRERQQRDIGIPYPRVPRAALDHVFTTDRGRGEPEWGIEVKRLQLVGDNGKRNDYATTKVLSPYLKDRGMLHDAIRLREYGFTRRIAVVGYCFDYDSDTLDHAMNQHAGSPRAEETIEQIRSIVDSQGALRIRPLVEFADAILSLRGYVVGPRAQAHFQAWRHPAGGLGTVFGWEIRRPWLEADYDPRHPW